jgi:hypothetical protein
MKNIAKQPDMDRREFSSTDSGRITPFDGRDPTPKRSYRK